MPMPAFEACRRMARNVQVFMIQLSTRETGDTEYAHRVVHVEHPADATRPKSAEAASGLRS